MALLALNCFLAARETPAQPPPEALLAPGKVALSQAEAIQQALVHNRTLEVERKNLKIAHGVSLEARAILLPQVKLDGQYAVFDGHQDGGSTPGLGIPRNLWMGVIRVTQSIYEGGRMFSASHTSRWTRERAIFHYDQTLSGVILKVRLAYQDALLAQARIHFLQEFANIQRSETAQVKDKVQAGFLAKLELSQAEVDVANLEAKLVTARNQLKLSLIRLLDVLGTDSSESAADSLKLTDTLTLDPLTMEMAEARQKALADRADLKAFERTVQLSGEDVAKTRSGYKPSVQLVGGYTGFEDSIGRNLRGSFGGVQASWVWFDGLATQGRIEQANSAHEKSQIELEDLKKQIDVEVRTAYFDVIEARERYSALQKALDSATEALRQAHAEFEAGSATRYDVLRSERAREEIQVSQLEALYAYNAAMARLEYSIGLAPATGVRGPPGHP